MNYRYDLDLRINTSASYYNNTNGSNYDPVLDGVVRQISQQARSKQQLTNTINHNNI
jgi:hypothetical protein